MLKAQTFSGTNPCYGKNAALPKAPTTAIPCEHVGSNDVNLLRQGRPEQEEPSGTQGQAAKPSRL